jgi:hypothetical protein
MTHRLGVGAFDPCTFWAAVDIAINPLYLFQRSQLNGSHVEALFQLTSFDTKQYWGNGRQLLFMLLNSVQNAMGLYLVTMFGLAARNHVKQ